MQTFLQEVRQAFRIFFKSPSLVAVIVLTLGLGIGANTAIFSLMNAVLLQKLPVHDPEHLVVVGDPTQVHYRSTNTPPRVDVFSYKLYTDLRDGNDVFSSMLTTGEVPRVRVARAGDSHGSIVVDQALGVLVSGNYFSVLGINAYLGRVITPSDDDAPGAHPVAVLSYGFWKEKLGGDPHVVGSTMLFNNYPFTVVGVADPVFFGDAVGDQQDIWFPVTMQRQLLTTRDLLKDYRNSWFHILGRLKPGVTLTQARANINLVFQHLVDGPLGDITQFTDKQSLRNLHVEVEDGGRGLSQLRGKYQQPLWLLMGIVGLVLLIACANVANLLLARALARHREMAVRLAIGAPPWRIIRQLLIESILLSASGGVLGLLIAQWAVGILLQMSQTEGTEVHLDLHVLLFTGVICIITGILFGLMPAVRAVDVAISAALKPNSERQGSGISANPAKWNWGKILVAAQVALSVGVLFTAGLFVRSMQNLRNVHLGFNDDNLLLVRLDQISANYTTPEQRAQLADQLAARFSSLPGVQHVTFGQIGLFFGDEAIDEIKIDGFVPKKSEDWNAPADRIGPNYFSMLGVPLIRGRELTEQDSATAPKTTVINQALANFYFGKDDPIGKTLWITDGDKPDPYTIVGIVSDFRTQSLRNPIDRRFFVSMAQSPEAVGSLNFMIRTGGDPANLIDTVHKTVREFNSGIPIIAVRTLSDRIDESIRSEILIARLSGFFGLVALLLACVGLYGIMSYMVAGKTRAIGVRMALGAQRQDVLWMVLWDAMVLVIVGVLIGVPVSLLCSNLLSSLLYGLKTSDPAAMSFVILLLAVVSIMASYVPARRATRVDPLVALRDE
jgi:predicted permease